VDRLVAPRALYTFSFLTLLYFAVFSIVSARERRWFWATMPSKTLVGAVVADGLAGTVLTFVGLRCPVADACDLRPCDGRVPGRE
jgi:hypothetical protein